MKLPDQDVSTAGYSEQLTAAEATAAERCLTQSADGKPNEPIGHLGPSLCYGCGGPQPCGSCSREECSLTPPQRKALLGYLLDESVQTGVKSRWSSTSLTSGDGDETLVEEPAEPDTMSSVDFGASPPATSPSLDRLAATASPVVVPSRTEYADRQYAYLSPDEREDRVRRSRTDIARDLLAEQVTSTVERSARHVLDTGQPAAGSTMAGRSALVTMPALCWFNGEELAKLAAVFKGRVKAHELREQNLKINNPKGGGKAPKDEP